MGSKQNLNIQMWEKEIDEEIHILLSHNILTSQLAIAIYKACTLQFKDSNTKIGRYYYSHLGVRSKTMQLPNIYNAKYKKPRRLAKAYDLNKSPNMDNLFYISRKKTK
ncbi:hypothetical protein HUE87_05580 [Candidatus Sulfurimonas marisnigri]|uniref:Uncharacterized protein n=1 Tax=Candidatus Sulfurimonas marisnigri TaxID=2740405 RepID=A0A7S7RRL3_9BACT|nr:hypothetical protein [Candidatus Sulfurimonas marisnigri]QOY55695.1 hypothetical protein HUE87_05580 [Candidatus Sulfurimonas marisnigri]